jgi:hypothetical protein
MPQSDKDIHSFSGFIHDLILTEDEASSVAEFQNLSASQKKELLALVYNISIALYHSHENDKQP